MKKLRQHADVLQVDVKQLLQARPLHLDHHLLAVDLREVWEGKQGLLGGRGWVWWAGGGRSAGVTWQQACSRQRTRSQQPGANSPWPGKGQPGPQSRASSAHPCSSAVQHIAAACRTDPAQACSRKGPARAPHLCRLWASLQVCCAEHQHAARGQPPNPLLTFATWTWPSEAAAMGLGSNSSNISFSCRGGGHSGKMHA